MTPPEAPVAGDIAKAADQPPAVSVCLTVIRKRPDFLKVAKGLRQSTPGFALQAMRREDSGTSTETIRVGFTCSKKVGNAVARNRAKRRLREIARRVLPVSGQPGWDYVLIGRANVTADRDFAELQQDLHRALQRIHPAGS
jgi:ribonuclease P protein component